MSNAFRELLRKVGSGVHTGKDLNRVESMAAARMMLLQEATPAQIGAFMIAHRIKRPTGEELAGILDAYEQLGPKLQTPASSESVTVLSNPYDGRLRTAPVSPITALILAAAGCPAVMHGGDRMPTKYGIPLVDIWQGLGVDWTPLTLEQVQQVLNRTGLGLVYLPHHFPLAHGLVPYRDQIGKRPPFATVELMWSPCDADARVVVGYVHPPTEGMAQTTFALRGTHCFITVKGLEGSCDLPRERTAIIGLGQPGQLGQASEVERLLLHPRDYDMAGKDLPLEDLPQLLQEITSVLQGQPGELMQSALWNGGFYLWQAGAVQDFNSGLGLAETLLQQGVVQDKLRQLEHAVADCCVSLQT